MRALSKEGEEFVSASELARMGYCERQIALDAKHGRSSTPQQVQARARGLKAHAAYYEESRRIAHASPKKGRCFVATLALGECEETSALRVFRDLYLRRTRPGRWLIGAYYGVSPRLCAWLDTWPTFLGLLRPIVRWMGRLAKMAVARTLG
jgi:hypothetical protein